MQCWEMEAACKKEIEWKVAKMGEAFLENLRIQEGHPSKKRKLLKPIKSKDAKTARISREVKRDTEYLSGRSLKGVGAYRSFTFEVSSSSFWLFLPKEPTWLHFS